MKRGVKIGDTERAKDLSGRFKNRTLKAIAMYGFDKCGNCVNRIKCGEEILGAGKKKNQPLKSIVDSMMDGCPKAKYSSKSFIAKEVAEFIFWECARCDKNDICIGYIADHVGRRTPEEKAEMIERFKGCLACKDLDNCIQHQLNQLGISKLSLFKNTFLVKFRKCNHEKMMLISLDLPDDAQTNVGGTVRSSPEKTVK